VSRRYLAFDLGAESGRAMLGTLGDDGRLAVEEVHRFPNRPVPIGEHLHWDITGLWRAMLDGLSACAARHGQPTSIGVDTWGVDFGLLGAGGELVGLPRCYRDPHAALALHAFATHHSVERLYHLTGVQVLPINSVFQLYGMVRHGADALTAGRHLLFMPDLFHYFLTGQRCTERTFATTSQLYDPRAGAWSREVFDQIGAPMHLMQRIVPSGTPLGTVTGPAEAEGGMGGVRVVAVATHDTASAVAAVPAIDADFAYISAGTWFLVGIESPVPIISPATFAANITNEGGVAGTVRVLKNVTGLWLLEQCRRAWGPRQALDHHALVALARSEPACARLIDPDFPFGVEGDVPERIAAFCRLTGQPAPMTAGAFARAIFDSLALACRHVVGQIGAVGPRPIRRIHIVGGGAHNDLLCQLTADATGLPVEAGPAEATAIGNLLVQAMADGAVRSLAELRSVVRASFPTRTYEPGDGARWDDAYARFQALLSVKEVHR
jgi:rhamnulokinase